MSRLKKSVKNGYVALTMNVAILLLTFISRKVFIDHLGLDITGLNSTLSNLLGFLNLAEMGVLTAVAFALYKPLAINNNSEVNKIISLLCYLYRRIGFFVLGLGVVISLFLPLIFDGKGTELIFVYVGFYVFLFVNLCSYFFNYRQNIFVADQRNWINVFYQSSVTFFKVAFQVLFLLSVPEDIHLRYFGYLFIEVIFAISYSIVINRKVSKYYPNLSPSYSYGRAIKGEFASIFKNIKQIFANKFGNFILTQTDSLVLTIVTSSLAVVAVVDNYLLIFVRLSRLIFSLFDNISAGLGNLIAEGHTNKVYGTYRQLNAIFCLFASFVVICASLLTNPFIELWLGRGDEFVLDNNLFLFILANVFITILRRPQEVFLSAFGLFSDVWASWTEALLNLAISLVLGFKFGVIGVLLGTFVSTFLIGLIWKPYFLFHNGIQIRVWNYWKHTLKMVGLASLVGGVVWVLNSHYTLVYSSSYSEWFLSALLLSLCVIGTLMLLFALFDNGMKEVLQRIPLRKIFKF